MQRVLAAHGQQWATGTVADWTAHGSITYFTVAGPGPTFDLTLVRKGPSQVQRIVKQSGLEVRLGPTAAKLGLSQRMVRGEGSGTDREFY
jgi:hypothetical protein